jgi:3-oxoacyl-[acyl-carrier-protein] synthase-3
VLSRGEQSGTGFLAQVSHCDGRVFDHLVTRAPGAAHPRFLDADLVDAGAHQFRMQGRPMFEHASRSLAQVAEEILAVEGIPLDAVDLVIPHQPNLRILERVGALLSLPPEKMAVTVDRLGNMGSASVPVTLALMVEEQRFSPGQLGLLLSYGAGATWSAALYRFPDQELPAAA